MGKPAARVGDMHVCPMMTPGVPPIPHVGGPLLPPGIPTVLIGGMPAAVMGNMAVCVGPPDSVVLGSVGVMIGGQPAARMGDTCAHGGTIVLGLPTVLIGETMPGAPPVTVVVALPSAGAVPGDATEVTSPQAQTMMSAAERGTPFCEVCEEARSEEKEKQEKVAEPKTAWFEIEVVDDDGKKLVGEAYRIELPDGTKREGLLDGKGRLRLEGIEPGKCKIEFPNLKSRAH